MTRRSLVIALAGSLALAGSAVWGQQAQPAPPPTIVVETVKGVFEIETFNDCPLSVGRILELVRSNFYRGNRFHWVQPGVVQFGDPLTRDMTKQNDWGRGGSGLRGAARPLGVVETSKRSFDRGIVGFAYLPGRKPDTADSQLFILKIANPAINGKYAVIGRVRVGMDVVEKIERADMIKRVSIKGATP